jgi:hypothetical protein
LKNSDFGQNPKLFPRTTLLQYFGEGFDKIEVPSPVASLWNHSRQSSLSFRKSLYLAEKFEVQFREFFNRIGRHSALTFTIASRMTPLLLDK